MAWASSAGVRLNPGLQFLHKVVVSTGYTDISQWSCWQSCRLTVIATDKHKENSYFWTVNWSWQWTSCCQTFRCGGNWSWGCDAGSANKHGTAWGGRIQAARDPRQAHHLHWHRPHCYKGTLSFFTNQTITCDTSSIALILFLSSCALSTSDRWV